MTPEIVLVEDNTGHARLFQIVLRQGGIDAPVHWVQNGHAALDFVYRTGPYQTRPDSNPFAIVLDLSLPGIDGFAVLERLRSDDSIGHLPIMVLTTSDDPHDLRRSLDLGCDDFLCKGAAFSDPPQLAAHINYLLSLLRKSPREQTASG